MLMDINEASPQSYPMLYYEATPAAHFLGTVLIGFSDGSFFSGKS